MNGVSIPSRTAAVLALLVACTAGCQGTTTSPGPYARTHTYRLPDNWFPWHGLLGPDGRSIAVLAWDPQHRTRVALLDKDANFIPITPPSLTVTDVAWMPDGDSVLVSYGQPAGAAQFAVIGLDGGILRRIAPSVEVSVTQRGLAVREDATRALVAAQHPSRGQTQTDLYEIALADGTMRQVTDTPRVSEASPAYVDDSTAIAAAGVPPTSVPMSSPWQANGWAETVSIRSGLANRITPPTQVVASVTVPSGGSAVVYQASDSSNASRNGVWIIPMAGGTPRLIIGGDVRFPSMSTDSDRVLVHSVGPPGVPGGFHIKVLPGA
jgi:hypothetical protein